MLFTDKIFKKKIDDSVHDALVRFSKGTFEGRGAMKITIPKGVMKLVCSYDLVKDLTKIIAGNIDKIKIQGIAIKNKKKKEFDEEVSGEDLKKICDENNYVLLNLNFKDYSVKVGKKLPKPGKEPKKNFCKCILPLTLLPKITDLKDFKKVEVTHTIIVDEIIVPKELKEDFAQARLAAKRKGKIIKKSIIDKKEFEEEIEFEA